MELSLEVYAWECMSSREVWWWMTHNTSSGEDGFMHMSQSIHLIHTKIELQLVLHEGTYTLVVQLIKMEK